MLTAHQCAQLRKLSADEALEAAYRMGLEKAAMWHDEKAAANYAVDRDVRGAFHTSAAANIRALASTLTKEGNHG